MAKVIFEGCDFYHPSTSTSKITIKPTINGDDLVKYHKNDTQYYVGFTDNKGTPLTNTEITFNINGVSSPLCYAPEVSSTVLVTSSSTILHTSRCIGFLDYD